MMIGKEEVIRVLRKHIGAENPPEKTQDIAQEIVNLEQDWEGIPVVDE